MSTKQISTRDVLVDTLRQLLAKVHYRPGQPFYASADGLTLLVGPSLWRSNRPTVELQQLTVSAGYPPVEAAIAEISIFLWQTIDAQSCRLRYLGETDSSGRVAFSSEPVAGTTANATMYRLAASAPKDGNHRLTIPDSDRTLLIQQGPDGWRSVEGPGLEKLEADCYRISVGASPYAEIGSRPAEPWLWPIVQMIARALARETLVSAEPLKHVPWEQLGGKRYVALAYGMAAHARPTGTAPPPPQLLRGPVELRGDRLFLKYESAEVPFGIVRVFVWNRDDDTLLGTCLLPMLEDDERRFRANSLVIDKLIGGCDRAKVGYDVQPAKPEILEWFSANEVRALLDDPDVASNPSLQRDVKELLRLLESQHKKA